MKTSLGFWLKVIGAVVAVALIVFAWYKFSALVAAILAFVASLFSAPGRKVVRSVSEKAREIAGGVPDDKRIDDINRRLEERRKRRNRLP